MSTAFYFDGISEDDLFPVSSVSVVTSVVVSRLGMKFNNRIKKSSNGSIENC